MPKFRRKGRGIEELAPDHFTFRKVGEGRGGEGREKAKGAGSCGRDGEAGGNASERGHARWGGVGSALKAWQLPAQNFEKLL